MPLPPRLGLPVTTRTYSLLDMVAREWGGSFRAPDHRVYQFTGKFYDSTDDGTTGFYTAPKPQDPKVKYTGIGQGNWLFGYSAFGVDKF